MTIRVSAPAQLDVFHKQQRASTVEFFRALRLQSRRPGISVLLDLRDVESIYPGAAVLLLAELHRSRAGGTVVQCARPRNLVMDEVFQQIGLYDRLGIPCTPSSQREDVRHWRAATGVLSEGQKGGSILQDYEGRLADRIVSGLYAGIVEAMTNTVHHAYEGELGRDLKHQIGRRWWMLSQERDGMLTVAICDLGIGIPRSLPRSSTFPPGLVREVRKQLGVDRSDASAIKVAIELGKTRTQKRGRGKGLSEIVSAVNLSPDGAVLISSNRGVFTQSSKKSYVGDHTHSIRGTLVHWTVTIADAEERREAERD